VRLCLNRLSAALTLPRVSGPRKRCQRAAHVVRPSPGGAQRLAVWAAPHEARCSDQGMAPPGCAPRGVPQRWVEGT